MRLDAFRALVRSLAEDVPEEYFEGVLEVEVSPRTLPHPTRAGIYTLGECIPVTGGGSEGPVQSRVVLYHELRHHLEWRANAPNLEAFDRAAEQNFARVDGEAFDPLFFLDGDSPVPDVYQVDDDWFYDLVVRGRVDDVTFVWHGRRYAVRVPPDVAPPSFLIVEGVDQCLVAGIHPQLMTRVLLQLRQEVLAGK